MTTVKRATFAGLFVVLLAGCGSRIVDPARGESVEAGTSSVTPAPACAGDGGTLSAPACGETVLTCDPIHPQGLPVGACNAGDTCNVTARFACTCEDELGPMYPYACTCASGAWKCAAGDSDARACTNACLVDAGPGSDAGPAPDGASGCPAPKKAAPPGPYVTSRMSVGSGACGARTLGQAIDLAYALDPALKDITEIYDPKTAYTDGSFIYAFALPSGGFALAFKRGGGDCPAGCTENEYWYFETDGACTVRSAGHYHPVPSTGCIAVEGAPKWATPAPFDPAAICGADATAKNISGTYTICASGIRDVCATKGSTPSTPVDTYLTVTIAQGTDLSKGTITVSGAGHPRIDGVPIDATFTRSRLHASKVIDNLPAKCIDQFQVAIDLDFEGIVSPGTLRMFESHSVGCSEETGGGDYCKGALVLDLVP